MGDRRKTARLWSSGTWRELLTASTTHRARRNGVQAPVLKPCVSHDVLERLGDKWTTSVVWVLAEAPGHRLRFSAIRNGIEGIAQRMLTVTLRGLERDGLVVRHYYPEVPPRVEYELSDLGLRCSRPCKLCGMVGRSWPRIEHARKAFDEIREFAPTPAGSSRTIVGSPVATRGR